MGACGQFNIAGVRLLDAPAQIDRVYSYFIPSELRDKVKIGSLVHAPFSRANREQSAVVTALSEAAEPVTGLKPLRGVREESPSELSPEMMALCAYLVEQTFCSYGEAVRCLLPAGALFGVEDQYSLTEEAKREEALEGCNEKALLLCEWLEQTGTASGVLIKKKYGEEIAPVLRQLTERGVLRREYKVKDRASTRFTEYYAIPDPAAAEAALEGKTLRGSVQKAIVAYLLEHGTVEASTLREQLGATAAQLRSLREKGLIEQYREEALRLPKTAPLRGGDSPLSDEQRAAADQIISLRADGKAAAALLYGVTGSGKTRVIREVIGAVLAEGKQVIVLVPEISLTPQTVGIFTACYGDRVAVVHSGLSDGERYDAWRRMRDGRADICIGTRSAVFAPFDRLGLIVIDEEQEHTYKSDSSPRYHARDVARFRCACADALLLLASATPSVESFYKAKTGVYTLVELRHRYGEAKLPRAFLCDLRGDGSGQISPIGELLRSELTDTLENGEQAILFVGRRGYHHFMTCTRCGNTLCCPNCSVSLTYHSVGRYLPEDADPAGHRKHGYLLCHYCGYKAPVPESCPECGSDAMTFLGYGTQTVESELCASFPEARIQRMDADTTGSKFAYDKMLGAFRRREKDILLGTQMVTKGHDFPGVTLVGIVMADSGLYLDDYRAGEKTFALVTQVIGRAGRAEKPGRAVIQTYNPDHPTLRLAAAQDYDGFYENEIALRRALCFPPFCDLLQINLSAGDETALQSAVRCLGEILKEQLAGDFKDVSLQAFGPFEAPVYRVKGNYRMRFLLKCKNNKRTREYLRQSLAAFREKAGGKFQLSLDFNPGNG